jgi:sigma-B regulation protein RsbU (phosphoserine phosphatase)
MSVTTTLLVVVVVAGIALLDGAQVSKIYDEAFSERVEQYDESLRVKGESTVAVFSQAVLVPLMMNSWEDVRGLVRKTQAQDPDLKVVYVLDRNRQLVAHSGVNRYEDDLKPVSDPSWPALLDQWKKRQTGTRALARLDLDVSGGQATRFFAEPVMSGNAPPTAEVAARDEAGDDRLGYVVLGYSLEPITRFAGENTAAKNAAWESSLRRTLLIGALFVLVGSMLAVLQGFRIARPIRMLTHRASQIAQGDLEARVEVRSGDEVGVLAENFNYMADQIAVLLTDTADKAALEKELEVTRVVQERLLPTVNEIRVGSLSLAAFYEPASTCGGDWWTCHDLPEGKSLIVVGDVTGHGVPAAMVTATAKAACDVVRALSRRGLGLPALMDLMNFAILESAKREFQMTCFASIHDPTTNVLEFANASHNPPLLFRPFEQGRARFKSLLGSGTRLGDSSNPSIEFLKQDLRPGDIVIWYTDGIIDCVNKDDVEYGIKRFMTSIDRIGDVTAVDMRDRVVAEALAFYGSTPRRDDMTLVVGKVDGI